jgi:hypothetical protein
MAYCGRLDCDTNNTYKERKQIMSYKQEHIWNESNDRWIFIEHKDGILVGLNYMQGNEYETFKSNFAKNDEKLTEFAIKMLDFRGEETYIEFINKVIWLHFELFQQA